MSNAIRYYMKSEIESLLPVLHQVYREIGRYQKSRSERAAVRLAEQLEIAGEALQRFKKQVTPRKRPYFDAILNHSLSLSDRIVALDTAVGALHVEFSVERAYVHQESRALRDVLDQCRLEADTAVASASATEEVLLQGLPAAPGLTTGKAAIIKKNADYRRLAYGSIVVAYMTRPELIFGLPNVAGIVTDVGSRLGHAAIVAREMGIPCVVGVNDATMRIKNRALIRVDGASGVIRFLR